MQGSPLPQTAHAGDRLASLGGALGPEHREPLAASCGVAWARHRPGRVHAVPSPRATGRQGGFAMQHQAPTRDTTPCEVIALVGSAGSHAAIGTILHALPAAFPVPLVVLQHLGPESTRAADLYGRAGPCAVAWAASEATLAPHQVLVGPPRSFLELLPDGTCVVAPCARGALEHPFDRFLESVAR